MNKWKYGLATIVGLLAILALTIVPAAAQGPALPEWAQRLMANCPGCYLRLTATGYMLSSPDGWRQYLDYNGVTAYTVGADPARGWSVSSSASQWGTAFYDPLPASEAVRGTTEIIRQQAVPPAPAPAAPAQKYDPEKFQPPVWYNPFTGAVGYTMPSSWLLSLIAFNNYWSRVQRNLVGPVVN